MKQTLHYEAALADYLRSRGLPYVAVDEARQSVFAGTKIKSFDFVVYRPGGSNWLVDVKGRKFPYSSGGSQRYWENWITQADLDGLEQWEAVFGQGFEAVLLFAYWLQGDPARWPTLRIHPFNGRYYAFYGITLSLYRQYSRVRSGRWSTVSMPQKTFRRFAYPFAERVESTDISLYPV